jgi:2-polyprenyl-3-methyl-5-hydroxy-6-metoxy-1,4-benzoquinol methylase
VSEAASRSADPGAIEALLEILGGVDIYLLDQLMKGRIGPRSRILDAGCGGGRNIEPFLRLGFDVWAVDMAPRATRQAWKLAREVGSDRPRGWISRQAVETLGFRAGSFDVVISNAVLHFARHSSHWESMLLEMWRVLAPGGLFFSRLATSIGIESEIEPLGDGRYHLPGGQELFLVDRDLLVAWTGRLGATAIEPIKTTVVDSLRAMTTWCLVKGG